MQQIEAPASWDHALRALERDLAHAEELLAHGDAPASVEQAWVPPTGLGLIPDHLMDRARALLERQLTVARQLSNAADDSRRHDRALSHLAQDAPRPPVYLDTPA